MKVCNSCNLPKEKYYKGNNVCADCFRERRYAHRRAHPKLRMLCSARFRAKQENVPCSITEHDFDIPEHCPILGTPLKPNFGRGGWKDDSPSLDKIIPEKGYIPGNIAVISFRANRLKNNASLEEIEKVAAWLKAALLVNLTNAAQ